jgi:hypothetical protein
MGLDELKEKLMNEPRTYPAGVTCWVDIEDADVEEAARFWCYLREIRRFAIRRAPFSH